MTLFKNVATLSAVLLLSVSAVSAETPKIEENTSWFSKTTNYFWGSPQKETDISGQPVVSEQEEKKEEKQSWGSYLWNGAKSAATSTASFVGQFGVVEAAQYMGAELGGRYAESKERAVLDAACEAFPAYSWDRACLSMDYANRLQMAYEYGAQWGGIAGHIMGGVGYDIAAITYNTLSEVYNEYKNDLEAKPKSGDIALGVTLSVLNRIAETHVTDLAAKTARKFAQNTIKYTIRNYISNPAISGTTNAVASALFGENGFANVASKVLSLPTLGYLNQQAIMNHTADFVIDTGLRAGSYFGSKVVVGGGKWAINAFSNWYNSKPEQTQICASDSVITTAVYDDHGSNHETHPDNGTNGAASVAIAEETFTTYVIEPSMKQDQAIWNELFSAQTAKVSIETPKFDIHYTANNFMANQQFAAAAAA